MPTFKLSKKVRPLQAADFYAWWVRHWEVEGKNPDAVVNLDFPWPNNKKIPMSYFKPTKKDFLDLFGEIFNDYAMDKVTSASTVLVA